MSQKLTTAKEDTGEGFLMPQKLSMSTESLKRIRPKFLVLIAALWLCVAAFGRSVAVARSVDVSRSNRDHLRPTEHPSRLGPKTFFAFFPSACLCVCLWAE